MLVCRVVGPEVNRTLLEGSIEFATKKWPSVSCLLHEADLICICCRYIYIYIKALIQPSDAFTSTNSLAHRLSQGADVETLFYPHSTLINPKLLLLLLCQSREQCSKS